LSVARKLIILKAIIPKTQYQNIINTLETSTLPDLSISRPISRLSWGIQVPNDPNHTIYVWLDALTNYLTVTGYPESQQVWPPHLHVIGKDIIKFHSIYWPSFLLAADLPLPRCILSHAHFLKNSTKMSKSLGNVIKPHPLLTTYSSDITRYFLVRDGGIENDAEVSEEGVLKRYKEMAGSLGNLVMRCSAKSVNPSQTIPVSFEGVAKVGIESDLIGGLNGLPSN
jgi:methionyl-tRNA synthetase